MDPPILKASPFSEMTITISNVNSLGFKTPFSKVQARFEIEEGSKLVELENFVDNNKVKIKSKGFEGEVVLGIYSMKSGILLRKLSIKIVPGNLARSYILSDLYLMRLFNRPFPEVEPVKYQLHYC